MAAKGLLVEIVGRGVEIEVLSVWDGLTRMAPFWGVRILVETGLNSPIKTPSAEVPSSLETNLGEGTRAPAGTPWAAVAVVEAMALATTS